MTTLVLEEAPVITDATIDDDCLALELADGRELRIPLSWYPRLAAATPAERRNWRLLGHGYAIEWPDVDEHIGLEGLLAGRRSGESERSLRRWLATRHAA